jgi:signal transduction histidine kinase
MQSIEALIEGLPAAAYTCDSQGLITSYNAAAVQLWGRTPLLHDPSDRYCGSFKLFDSKGEPLKHSECWMALALRDGKSYNAREVIIERPDRSRVTALAYANPFKGPEGQIRGALNILVDLSERREAEQQLLTFQRLAVFGQLAAGFAHEVRNPLAAILGSVQLAKRRVATGQDPSQQLDIAQRQVERLKTLMEDMLQHAKSSKLAPTLIDPCAILEKAVEQAIQQFGPNAANIRVISTCMTGQGRIQASEERLLRLLSNLALNALQALGPEGGKLFASAGVEGSMAVLKVEDDGPGFEAGSLPKLFEPFFSTKPTGSGLGLWIAQSLANEMGGELSAHAVQPHGARFELRLPLA